MDGREFDKEYNLQRAEALMRKAAARGARILCSPEVALQGYPRVRLQPDTPVDDPKLVEMRRKILTRRSRSRDRRPHDSGRWPASSASG